VVGQSLLPLMVGIASALRVDDLADVVAGDAHGLPVDALCMCDPIIAVDIMGVEVALFKYKGALPYERRHRCVAMRLKRGDRTGADQGPRFLFRNRHR